ncbi:MAG: hypothetical protein ABIZ81_00805 [Opitutaceae bacterium]
MFIVPANFVILRLKGKPGVSVECAMNLDRAVGRLSGTGILPVFRAHGQDARATPIPFISSEAKHPAELASSESAAEIQLDSSLRSA